MTQKKLKIAVMSVRAKFISFILLLGCSFVSSSYAQTLTQSIPLYKDAVPEAISKQYPVLSYKFIDLIKAIPKPLPASLKKFQKIFNNQFLTIEKDDTFITYSVGPFKTLDGVVIQKIEISTHLKASKQIEGVGIDLDPKQCVSTKLLKKEFGFLIPQLLFSHPEPNAPIAFNTPDEWGKFAMGSTMDSPNCAAGVGILSFSDKQEKKEWIQYVRKQAPHLR